MALVIETHIICDTCGTAFGVDNRHLKGMQQRERSIANGWTYNCSVDTCPDCRPKNKDGKIYKHSKSRARRKPNK